jgi:hypothetical protein
VFQGALLWTCAMTLFWVVMMVLGPERAPFFGRYRIDQQALGAVLFGFLVFNVIWGAIWWGIRYLVLRKFVGMSKDDAREIFTSRMHHPFDLARYLGRYSERRIRITDMIGRPRTVPDPRPHGLPLHLRARGRGPKPEYLVFGAGDSLFDAMVACWIFLAFYYSDGFFGRVMYGAQARLMDGILGRANCLLISMLWSAFKFIFVPLSLRLAAHFPPETFAPLFAFIWVSYLAADGTAEIAGALFGKQKLKVWGMGEVNRKSIEGTVAGFLASLACAWPSSSPRPALALGGPGRRDLALEHAARAVLAARDRRLHHGHRERAALPGVRHPRLLRRLSPSCTRPRSASSASTRT